MNDKNYAGHTLAEIKSAAEAATPGPWSADEREQWYCTEAKFHVCHDANNLITAFVKVWDDGTAESLANARLVAIANPATVLALIARIEELEKTK